MFDYRLWVGRVGEPREKNLAARILYPYKDWEAFDEVAGDFFGLGASKRRRGEVKNKWRTKAKKKPPNEDSAADDD